jgi:hypothetical protein
MSANTRCEKHALQEGRERLANVGRDMHFELGFDDRQEADLLTAILPLQVLDGSGDGLDA